MNRFMYQVNKHLPDILLGAGLVGTISATAFACNKKDRTNDILEELEEDREFVKSMRDTPDGCSGNEYKKELVKVYAKAGKDLTCTYAPAVALGVASIGLIFKSNNILKDRNFALSTTCAALGTAFTAYRGRVAEKIGEDAERGIYLGAENEKLHIKEIDEEGKEHKKTKTVTKLNTGAFSPYVKIFDAGSRNYTKDDPDANVWFLHNAQQFFTNKLHAERRVFLNEVLDYLDIPKTKAGQIVGWDLNAGDDFVDFGVLGVSVDDNGNPYFVNGDTIDGYNDAFLLDFNCRGNIWDDMPEGPRLVKHID